MEKEEARHIDERANPDLMLPENYKNSKWQSVKRKIIDFANLVVLIFLVYVLFYVNYILLHHFL